MRRLLLIAALALSTNGARADDSRVNLWPLYGRDAEGAVDVVWPLARFAHSDAWRVFPVFRGCDSLVVFPEFWFLRDSFAVLPLWAKHDFSEGWLFPVADWDFDGEERCHGLFPLYHYGWDGAGDSFRALAGLAGFSRLGDEVRSHWLLPFYVRTPDSFLSIPYSRTSRADGFTEGYVAGLAGRRTFRRGGTPGWDTWTFPLYYADSRGTLVTPLYGHTRSSRWCFPIWYDDENSFCTLLYGYGRRGSRTTTWWATPLVGTWSGSETGGWLFPIFSYRKDAGYERDVARLDEPTIPAEIAFVEKVSAMTNREGKVSAWTNVVPSVVVNSRRRSTVLFLSDHDGSVWGGATREGGYKLMSSMVNGNSLVFKRRDTRTVTYDLDTRRKTGESRNSETSSLFGLLFRRTTREGPDGRAPYSRTRVLWKLWDHEDRGNGTVTIDAFPGFTYDARPDGYRKTSLLWRLFRYEAEPSGATALDLLFIPIWRSKP